MMIMSVQLSMAFAFSKAKKPAAFTTKALAIIRGRHVNITDGPFTFTSLIKY